MVFCLIIHSKYIHIIKHYHLIKEPSKLCYCPSIPPPLRRSRCRRSGLPACRGARRRIPALVSSWGSCKMQLHVSCSKNVPPVLNFQYFTCWLLCISPLPVRMWCGSLLHTQADNCVLPVTCATVPSSGTWCMMNLMLYDFFFFYLIFEHIYTHTVNRTPPATWWTRCKLSHQNVFSLLWKFLVGDILIVK